MTIFFTAAVAAAIGCLLMHSILELLLSAFVRAMRTVAMVIVFTLFFRSRFSSNQNQNHTNEICDCMQHAIIFVISFLAACKLCSIVFLCFLSLLARLVTANSMRFCDGLIACSTIGNGSISFISSTHTPPASPRHFLKLGCLFANTHSYMERWLSFAEVFRYFHHTRMGVSGYDVCMCVLFMDMFRAGIASMQFQWDLKHLLMVTFTICSCFLLALVLFSRSYY